MVDANHISANNKARYFWGNLPGMNRPVNSLPVDRLTLDNAIAKKPEFIRVAELSKIQSSTAKINSIKLVKGTVRPVAGKERMDELWSTEMERFILNFY